LPAFTPDDQIYIAETTDFIGINHYSSYYVENYEAPIDLVSFGSDEGITIVKDPSWYG
jgi:beta-glucosidase/6-phospho-beta-glucosidase/beta-galactosidase